MSETKKRKTTPVPKSRKKVKLNKNPTQNRVRIETWIIDPVDNDIHKCIFWCAEKSTVLDVKKQLHAFGHVDPKIHVLGFTNKGTSEESAKKISLENCIVKNDQLISELKDCVFLLKCKTCSCQGNRNLKIALCYQRKGQAEPDNRITICAHTFTENCTFSELNDVLKNSLRKCNITEFDLFCNGKKINLEQKINSFPCVDNRIRLIRIKLKK